MPKGNPLMGHTQKNFPWRNLRSLRVKVLVEPSPRCVLLQQSITFIWHLSIAAVEDTPKWDVTHWKQEAPLERYIIPGGGGEGEGVAGWRGQGKMALSPLNLLFSALKKYEEANRGLYLRAYIAHSDSILLMFSPVELHSSLHRHEPLQYACQSSPALSRRSWRSGGRGRSGPVN